jgi:hypothetical protein
MKSMRAWIWVCLTTMFSIATCLSSSLVCGITLSPPLSLCCCCRRRCSRAPRRSDIDGR